MRVLNRMKLRREIGVLRTSLLWCISGGIVARWNFWNEFDWPLLLVIVLLSGVPGHCGRRGLYRSIMRGEQATSTVVAYHRIGPSPSLFPSTISWRTYNDSLRPICSRPVAHSHRCVHFLAVDIGWHIWIGPTYVGFAYASLLPWCGIPSSSLTG